MVVEQYWLKIDVIFNVFCWSTNTKESIDILSFTTLNEMMYCSQSDISRHSDGSERAAKYRDRCEHVIFDDTDHSGHQRAIFDVDLGHVFIY